MDQEERRKTRKTNIFVHQARPISRTAAKRNVAVNLALDLDRIRLQKKKDVDEKKRISIKGREEQ